MLPGGTVVKNVPANAEDAGLISGSGRSPGVGNDIPFQYSYPENSMSKGAWRATVKRVTESDTTEQLATRSGQWEARADFWFGRNFIAGV